MVICQISLISINESGGRSSDTRLSYFLLSFPFSHTHFILSHSFIYAIFCIVICLIILVLSNRHIGFENDPLFVERLKVPFNVNMIFKHVLCPSCLEIIYIYIDTRARTHTHKDIVVLMLF